MSLQAPDPATTTIRWFYRSKPWRAPTLCRVKDLDDGLYIIEPELDGERSAYGPIEPGDLRVDRPPHGREALAWVIDGRVVNWRPAVAVAYDWPDPGEDPRRSAT